jgi:hypothetical protein
VLVFPHFLMVAVLVLVLVEALVVVSAVAASQRTSR